MYSWRYFPCWALSSLHVPYVFPKRKRLPRSKRITTQLLPLYTQVEEYVADACILQNIWSSSWSFHPFWTTQLYNRKEMCSWVMVQCDFSSFITFGSRLFCQSRLCQSNLFLPGVPYDIGYGQKLFLKCLGNGKPTGERMSILHCRPTCAKVLYVPRSQGNSQK